MIQKSAIKVHIGQIDLSFHHVAAAVVLRYFEQIGQEYELHTATHEKLFELYRNGTVDIVLGAWLPSSHGKYIAEVEHETERLGVLYKPYCIWGIPDYIPENQVTEVADLLKPEISNRFVKLIQGINEGAGISRFSRNIISAYHLDSVGFYFQNGTIPICTNTFVEAYKEKKWVIIPIWEPQYLFHTYKIRALNEPKGLLGTVDESTILVRKHIFPKLLPEAQKFLREISIGNTDVTALDYEYQVKNLPLEQISKAYLQKYLQQKSSNN